MPSELKVNKLSPYTGTTLTIGDSGDTVSTDAVVQASQFIGGGLNAYRNLIINGDMSIAQRGTSTAGVNSNGYYSVDRMRTVTNLGTFTVSQSTDVPTGQGFSSSFKYDCTTAEAISAGSDIMLLENRIEGQNVQQLKYGTSSAESLTLSFWVKSNKTGTYCLEFFNQDPATQRQTTQLYTIDSSNTWEKKTITISGDTSQGFTNDNNFSLGIFWWLGAGTDYTSGTRQTTWSDKVDANRVVGQTVNLADSTSNEWYITGVQLEVGTSASDFEFLPYDVNLQRCQRYYQRIQGNASDQVAVGNGFAIEITQVRTYLQLFTTMRVAPTLGENLVECLYGSSFSAAISLSSTLDEGINTYGITFTADTGSPFTQNDPVFVRLENSTSAFIEFGAEL